jgi:hypothetical protein
MILIFFFTSHYSVSVAGRSVLILNCLNISFRRWLAGDSLLLPVLFNWVTTTCLLEGYNYSIHKNKVDLFLDKEMNRKQEEQFKTILHHIPTNVMVICDSKIVLKNRHCENLIKFVFDELGPKTEDSQDPNFDSSQFFFHQQILRVVNKTEKVAATTRSSN